jgi:nitrite reductase/ring-hydroxylating ferredoxin subunit
MKKYTWHKIADSAAEINFGDHNLAAVEVNGKNICIARNGEKLQACSNKCPHASGTMSEGFMDAVGNIVCFNHRYKFSLENGRNTSGEGYHLKIYPIVEKEDGIYVGIEKSWLSF